MASIRSWLCIALVCLVAAGCAMGRSGVDIDYNDPLADRIIDVLHSGKWARLSDLTTFAWDEVHLFNEGASREQIEQAVGSPIIRDKFYWSSASLLVFEDNGQVV